MMYHRRHNECLSQRLRLGSLLQSQCFVEQHESVCFTCKTRKESAERSVRKIGLAAVPHRCQEAPILRPDMFCTCHKPCSLSLCFTPGLSVQTELVHVHKQNMRASLACRFSHSIET